MTFLAQVSAIPASPSTPPMPSTPSAREGLLARMVRLWIEHHQRMVDFGMRPL